MFGHDMQDLLNGGPGRNHSALEELGSLTEYPRVPKGTPRYSHAVTTGLFEHLSDQLWREGIPTGYYGDIYNLFHLSDNIVIYPAAITLHPGPSVDKKGRNPGIPCTKRYIFGIKGIFIPA